MRDHHPKAAETLEAGLGDVAPDLMRMIAEFPFGDLYARSGIDMKVRQTATLVALATGGHGPQLEIHLGVAKSMGFTRDELVEIFMQIAPYAGFPAAINAVMATKRVYEEPVSSSQNAEE